MTTIKATKGRQARLAVELAELSEHAQAMTRRAQRLATLEAAAITARALSFNEFIAQGMPAESYVQLRVEALPCALVICRYLGANVQRSTFCFYAEAVGGSVAFEAISTNGVLYMPRAKFSEFVALS